MQHYHTNIKLENEDSEVGMVCDVLTSQSSEGKAYLLN
jgi:hypothetical protein